MRPHGGRRIARRNFCPSASQVRDAKGAAADKRARKTARERTARLKGLLRIRRKTPSKKLRTHSRRQKYAPGFDSERLTRLCGAGAPFRPLFCPIPSCYVPGPKIFLPTTTTGLIYP